MHPNRIFRTNDLGQGIAFAQSRGFGILTVTGPDGVLASHVPFVAEADAIDMHLVRSNPIARLLRTGDLEALLIVSGPDSYVSPDWYGIDDQVPTWNYVAVHLRGTLMAEDEAALRPHLSRLSARNENLLLPKKPWTMDKNQPETLEKMMRMLVPAKMALRSIDATWKLNQNKPEHAIHGAADGVEANSLGHGTQHLADLMRTWQRG
ncbi:MAG: FMN-binding negative transcriptional regulator [Pseudomonadota bacterium]